MIFQQFKNSAFGTLSLSNNATCTSITDMFIYCGVPSDQDLDGVRNVDDNCPEVCNPLQEDNDGDGIGNICDNCPTIPNPGQADNNANSIGDACEHLHNGILYSADPFALVLQGVDDNCYRVKVDAEGKLLTELIPCP